MAFANSCARTSYGTWCLRVLASEYGYADITAPLTLLLKMGVVWRWRKDVEQASFDRHKSAVAHVPVLMHTDVSKPFVIVSDAADFAFGASLE